MAVRSLLVAAGLSVAVAAAPSSRVERPAEPVLAPVVAAASPATLKTKPRAPRRPSRPRIAIVSQPDGGAGWSLDDVPRVEQFYEETFGRPLPVSAYGQTELHDRLGFDHRDAIDVAVHPDSREGLALQQFLRAAGMPYIVARGSVRHRATGPHIHIGLPSHRLTTTVALSER